MPALVEARQIVTEFHMMIRGQAAAGLATWIERARASLASGSNLTLGARGEQRR
jgi:hypothetical protein